MVYHVWQELQAAWSDQTPSESLVTSEDEFGREGEGERREEEVGGKPHSTPPRPQDDAPFASDNIRDTVIRLDKV